MPGRTSLFDIGQIASAGLVILLFSVVTGCPEAGQPPLGDSAQCVPICEAENRMCGDDGCGGACGACEAGAVCSATGGCVASSEDCSLSCEEAGVGCGDHCGADCGSCGAGDTCFGGACVCAPTCSATACGQPDGCGSTCGLCPSAESCPTCGLTLSVVDKTVEDGVVTRLVLGLSYQADADTTLPSLADIRLKVEGPATLTRVGLGDALRLAARTAAPAPRTGLPWREMDDGVFQTLVVPGGSGKAEPIEPGRWLFYEFQIGDPTGPGEEPAVFSLVPREAILAPSKADETLWGTPIHSPVVVWRHVEVSP